MEDGSPTEDMLKWTTKQKEFLFISLPGPDATVMDRVRKIYGKVPFAKSEDKPEKKEDVDPSKLNFIKRLKVDEVYRKKYILSLGLLWSFVILGWIIGQFGPSFLDLQIITKTSLQKGSAFMTAHSVGYLTGSLISGLLFEKYHKTLLVFVAVFGNALTVAIIPWCLVYELMVLIHVVKGTFSGALDALGNAEMVFTWGEKGRSFMQALHFCFAFGGILSPLATAPFLAPRRDHVFPSRTLIEYDIEKTLDQYRGEFNQSGRYNMSDVRIGAQFDWSASNRTLTTTTLPTESYIRTVLPHKSNIYIAYLISAFLGLTAALPFFIMYMKSRHQVEERSTDAPVIGTKPRSLTIGQTLIVMAIMMCIMGTYSAIEDTFAGFLATFCVKQLDWAKSKGSFATSIYWTSFGGGRFCGIFLVKFLSPVRMICIYCFLLIIAFIGLFVTAFQSYDAGVWLCTTLIGLALSIIFPTIFIWTEEEMITVTGKVASLFLIASSTGTMVNPIVLGLLMDKVTPMWFCYLLLTESVTLLLLYLVALCISQALKSANAENKHTEEEDIIPEFCEDLGYRNVLSEDLNDRNALCEDLGTEIVQNDR